jgi:TPR repeat protein
MYRLLKILSLSAMLAFSAQVHAEPAEVQQAAEQGDAKAQAKLGAMYLLGKDVDKNEQMAAEWLLKAAKQGHLEAQVLVAALYDSGVGVKNDVKQATSWYEKAAAQGHTSALALLGKNPIAKGGVAFNYQAMRLSASKQIPTEYAKKILLSH